MSGGGAPARPTPLGIEGVDRDAVDWRRAGPRRWVYRRGGEGAQVRGPAPLGRGPAYRSRILLGRRRRLRPLVWTWSAMVRAAGYYGGGGCSGSRKRAMQAAEAELDRARRQAEGDPFRRGR